MKWIYRKESTKSKFSFHGAGGGNKLVIYKIIFVVHISDVNCIIKNWLSFFIINFCLFFTCGF